MKTFKRLVIKSINIFKYLMKVIERILKTGLRSLIMCCPVILTLVLINSLLGVHVRFSYYLNLALLTSFFVMILLCVLRLDIIFAKATKVSKKNVPAKIDRKAQRTVNRKKRRIS